MGPVHLSPPVGTGDSPAERSPADLSARPTPAAALRGHHWLPGLAGWVGNTLVVLFGVSVLSFTLTHLIPGDLAENMLTSQGIPATQEMLEETRRQLGLDRPLWQQYVDWLHRFVTGDLGTSFSMGTDIHTDFGRRLPLTIALTVVSLLCSWAIAVPVGLAAAATQRSGFDLTVRVLSYFSSALPGFVTALVVLGVLGADLGWFPISATHDARGLVMPVLAMVISMVGWYIRQIRTIALEELDKPYITGLRIRGMGETRISLHVLRNVAAPLATLAGSSFGAMLAGSAVIEAIFNWQGMGHYALSAISAKDYPVVQAYVVWCALVFLVANVLADLCAFALDPRLAGARAGRARRTAKKAEPADAEPLQIRHPDLTQLTRTSRPGRRTGPRPRTSTARPVLIWRILLGILLFIGAAGIFGPQLTPFDPYRAEIASALQGPSATHLLGTDTLGRDVLARVLAGIRPTLTLALTVVACSLAIGTLIGVVSATVGGKTDAVLQRVTAVFQSFPEFILALAFATMLGPGFLSAVVALTAAYWTRIARYARILTMQVKEAPYLQVARMNGVPRPKIFLSHLVPNIGSPLLVIAASDLGSVILNLATLSFVGLGLPQPTSEWGTMINEGRAFLQHAPWLVLGPGAALFLLTLTFNLFADTCQELLSANQRFRSTEKREKTQ